MVILLQVAGTTVKAQDYINKITENTCSCARKITDTLTKEGYSNALGVCIMEAAQPYWAKLKKDYGIDFSKAKGYEEGYSQGMELGKIIGFKMIEVCPDVIAKINRLEKTSTANKSETKILVGTITDISEEQFITFTVSSTDGKSQKFLWLTTIKSDEPLIENYKNYLNKNVSITYKTEKLFNPKTNNYQAFKIITMLKLDE